MNEIKVTVTYDQPNTSKFDALMAEYEAAKKYADEIVAYYTPLADAAEEAKFDAIMEQLETIKEYAKRISEITGKSTWIQAFLSAELRGYKYSENYKGRFEVIYRVNDGFEIMWKGDQFTKNRLKAGWYGAKYDVADNIIGMWDEWQVYQKLEENALAQMRTAIAEQKRTANQAKNRLYNITKGGN